MNKIKYLIPKTTSEAISLFEMSNGNSIYIAGGTDVILKIKNKKISPLHIISLNHIAQYKKIQLNKENKTLSLGATVTHRTLENSNLIKEEFPIIHDAVKNIGSVQIRNIATIGGNLVNAAPSADGAIPLIALDSELTLLSKNGERIVKLNEFFKEPGKTILKHGEILTKINIPRMDPNTSGAYKKFSRRSAMELPIIGVGVVLSLDSNLEICKKARICLGVAAPTPIRTFNAEHFLEGKAITEEVLSEAGHLSANESKVRDSIRGKAWHRKELISVFVKRMGLLAIKRLMLKKSTKNLK